MRGYYCFLLLLLASFSLLQATNFYVSPRGLDRATGSIENPFFNIQTACDSVGPGDTIFIRQGVYLIKNEILVHKSGTPDSMIVIMPYPGEHVTINANEYETPNAPNTLKQFNNLGAVFVKGASYVLIQNLNIVLSHTAGIMIRGPKTHHISIINCKVDRTYGPGIGVWNCEDIIIARNEVTKANDQDMRLDGQPLFSEAPHEAISIAGVVRFEVFENYVHLCNKEGIDCKENSLQGKIYNNIVHDVYRQGLYVDAWFGKLADVEIYNNIVYNCEWGIGISVENKNSSMENIRIHNNWFYNNRGSGVILGIWGANEMRSHIYIYNNTIYNNGRFGFWAGATGGIDIKTKRVKHLYIVNNVIQNNLCFAVAGTFSEGDLATKDIVIDNNMMIYNENFCVDRGFFNTALNSYKGNNTIQTFPAFNNPHKGDFSIQQGSQAPVNTFKYLPDFLNSDYYGAKTIE